MIGLHLDAARMAAIAEGLRVFIPLVSPEAARPMIDAAAELQRMADQVAALMAERDKELEKLKKSVIDQCSCDNCKARRAAESTPAPGSFN